MIEVYVTRVIDGDTFEASWDGKQIPNIRPLGYNTPEKGEIGYEQAKKKLKELIEGKLVELMNIETSDSFGRLLCQVFYNGMELSEYFKEYKV